MNTRDDLEYSEVSISFEIRGRRDPGISVSTTDVRVGWKASAGVETILRSNMKQILESLRTDLGSSTVVDDTLFPIAVI